VYLLAEVFILKAYPDNRKVVPECRVYSKLERERAIKSLVIFFSYDAIGGRQTVRMINDSLKNFPKLVEFDPSSLRFNERNYSRGSCGSCQDCRSEGFNVEANDWICQLPQGSNLAQLRRDRSASFNVRLARFSKASQRSA